MKTAVTIKVPIDPDWDGETRLQVYTDRGGGTVDTTDPLLPRPVEVFPGALRAKGFGRFPLGRGRFGSNKPAYPRNGGFFDQRFGTGALGRSKPFVRLTVNVPAVFGKWKFAVEAIDAEGNVQSDPITEVARILSAAEPPTIKSFAFGSYDGGTDQVTFSLRVNTE